MDPNTLIDAAFKVCTALDAAGAKAVLTGGSAATFYAPQAYQSDDVDFILMWTAGGSQAANALAAINVKQVRPGDYRYGNVTVEFPKGPLSIGAEQIPSERCITERRNGMVLHVLSPTDAVCRLESYYAYKDFSARAAASAIVLQGHAVDLEFVRAWTLREYAYEHQQQRMYFNEFLGDLAHLGFSHLPKRVAEL